MLAAKVAGTAPAPPKRSPEVRGTVAPAADAVELAWTFASSLADRLALRYDLGYGHGHVNSDAAASPDLNTLRVEHPVDASTLDAHASQLFGHGPRHIAVRNHAVALSVLPGLVSAGYRPSRTLVLERSGFASERARSDVSLRPATGHDDANLDVAYWSTQMPGASHLEVAQHRLADLLRGEPATVTRTAVWAPLPGAPTLTPVSRSVTTTFGDTSEIGRVFTAVEHRGRGFARTAVLASLHRAAGSRVFARVSPKDPALPVLAACGLVPAGALWTFTRA